MSSADKDIRSAIARVVAKHDLTSAQMQAAMECILSGNSTPAQIAGLIVGLRMKGESSEELTAAATVMRSYCVPVDLSVHDVILDTCGTGGDGAGTFNVSTVAGIVIAACGITVAKHGNRSVSSKCGSADILEKLGVRIGLGPEGLSACVKACNICFMFAPTHHPAMRHAAGPRKDLALRTMFNLLGPLTNPAGANHQLLGVYDHARLRQMAQVLGALGARRAWVVHGAGGVDEISVAGSTRVAEWHNGGIREWEVHPSDFGLEEAPLDAIAGGDAEANVRIVRGVLAGDHSPYRTAVLLNAAAGLCIAGKCDSLRDAAAVAADAIDSGAADRCLNAWIQASEQSQ